MTSLQRCKQLILALSLAGLAFHASAQTQVNDAWVRATVAGQQSTGAFMTLQASEDSKLLSVQSPIAKDVQIHESSMKNDVMSMRQVESIALPAGKTVSLDPHGYHVMLLELNDQVKDGASVPLTLTVENARGEKEVIEVQAPVKALNGMPMDHSKMH
ncbi:copper chaperone PCu(A)C [Pseudomonas sp. SZMC_28357]|uniref:copper chaperone PCu(A)C n=1 Tax=Pseudomonas sp. SZMC_28357 TaxID=3074380 RepID=UPI0028719708|nr:copper chaperone PCu(A)C [Pseudomonas sp. SZMC_28357]MDR9752430.1 copper chaperone PCu(A)C [Pseudomonas sp. SZMC_28357]